MASLSVSFTRAAQPLSPQRPNEEDKRRADCNNEARQWQPKTAYSRPSLEVSGHLILGLRAFR
jgi:hypothetical protein